VEIATCLGTPDLTTAKIATRLGSVPRGVNGPAERSGTHLPKVGPPEWPPNGVGDSSRITKKMAVALPSPIAPPGAERTVHNGCQDYCSGNPHCDRNR
jgi:hypothetical protein